MEVALISVLNVDVNSKAENGDKKKTANENLNGQNYNKNLQSKLKLNVSTAYSQQKIYDKVYESHCSKQFISTKTIFLFT